MSFERNVIVNITILFISYVLLHSVLVNFLNLMNSPPLLIPVTSLNSKSEKKGYISENIPTSKTAFSYNFWLYLEPNMTGKHTKIISVRDFEIGVNENMEIECSKIKDTIKIPLEKWVNISIQQDNRLIDFYVDGELVNTEMMARVPSALKGPVQIHTKDTPGYICLLRYYPYYILPTRLEEMYDAARPLTNGTPTDNYFWWN